MFVIIMDCVVFEYVEVKLMLLFCQMFFFIWGIVFGIFNFILGYKLDKQFFSYKKFKEKVDKIYIYFIYVLGVVNYFLCGIIVYLVFGVFGVYLDV